MKCKLFSFIFVLTMAIPLVACNNTSAPSANSGNVTPVVTYYWNQEIDANLSQTIGEYIKDLPVYTEGTAYATKNVNGDSAFYTYINFETGLEPSLANLVYKSVLVKNGFAIQTLESGVYCGNKSVSQEYTLVVQYSGYTQLDKNYFSIYTYLYQDKSISWPESNVISVVGRDIPHYETSYYTGQVATYNGVELFQIGCYNAGTDAAEEYASLLKENGYIVRLSSSAYNAVHNTYLINLDFYYDSDYDCLVIQGYLLDQASVWPDVNIVSLFGFHLPVYTDEMVTYLSGYVSLQVYEGSTYTVVQKYGIQCEYAPASCLLAYDLQMKEAGWTLDEDDLPDDWPLFLCSENHFNRYKMSDENGNHSVEVRYYDPEDPVQSGYELSYPIMLIIIYC